MLTIHIREVPAFRRHGGTVKVATACVEPSDPFDLPSISAALVFDFQECWVSDHKPNFTVTGAEPC